MTGYNYFFVSSFHTEVSCDRVDICHIHAQCVYDDQSLQHVCVCLAGYQGDGQVCTPQGKCD